MRERKVNAAMEHVPSKRAFLKGRFKASVGILPPGAVADFHALCVQCGDCARACPTSIIFRNDEGFPVIDLKAGACLFCNACAEACEPQAIQPATGWDWRATANGECLSVNAVMCRACEDHCDAQAIRFQLMTGGRSTPVFDAETCTGCGECAGACPADAIRFYQINQHSEERPC